MCGLSYMTFNCNKKLALIFPVAFYYLFIDEVNFNQLSLVLDISVGRNQQRTHACVSRCFFKEKDERWTLNVCFSPHLHCLTQRGRN